MVHKVYIVRIARQGCEIEVRGSEEACKNHLLHYYSNVNRNDTLAQMIARIRATTSHKVYFTDELVDNANPLPPKFLR
jgi:hypothetical protein